MRGKASADATSPTYGCATSASPAIWCCHSRASLRRPGRSTRGTRGDGMAAGIRGEVRARAVHTARTGTRWKVGFVLQARAPFPPGAGARLARAMQRFRRSAQKVVAHPVAFFVQVFKAFRANQGLLLSGGVAYYTLLSIVPLLILLVIVLSHVI